MRVHLAVSTVVIVSLVTPGTLAGSTVRPVQSESPPPFQLEDGTPVRLRLARTVSSADATVGDTVDFEVLEEIKLGDITVISKGSVAWGTVTRARSKRRMTRGGKLDINIDSVRLVTGEKAALRAVKEGSGGGHTGAMVGGMVATSIVFFPAAPLFLFWKGKDITVPKGTEITAYINGDTPLERADFGPMSGHSPQPAPLAQGSPGQAVSSAPVQILPSTVIIKSTPDGADITIDGKFVGSTPSTVQLPPGDYEVVIQKTSSAYPEGEGSIRAYRAWKRTLSLSPGSTITVDATLEEMR